MTEHPASVMDEELLARFILQSSWIREDKTVRQDAFIPPPDLELSVTRHSDLTAIQMWNIGRHVADTSARMLYGRADIQAISIRNQKLVVEIDPTSKNPNHTIIKGWPNDKPSQKMIAINLAASSKFVSIAT